jgi:hypothetical protein
MLADYIEETTTSIAGTSGDGAVTLSQITGMPRISTVFGTAARLVRYVIEDTVALKFEQGIGSVASNVLTRSTPRVTWDGSTYDDTNPSAIQFGSSPTSGNVKIRLAPLADSFVPTVPYHNTTASGMQDAGLMCGDIAVNSDAAAYTCVADREVWFPYLWMGSGELIQFALRVKGAVAASNVKACLSEVNSTGSPGTKLIDFGSVSSATTGFKTLTSASWTPAASVKLPPGYYFIGLIADSTQTLACAQLGQFRTTVLSPGSGYGTGTSKLIKAGSYATGLGSSPASLTADSQASRPVVWLKPSN